MTHRIFLLGALAAGSLLAQGPAASVQIVGPTAKLIVGDRVQLRAVVRDANGVERPTDIPRWTTNNVNIAAIEGNGELVARGLGLVQVTAVVGSASSSIFFQMLPKRVAITPSDARLTVGERLQFRAIAYDKNDQPIPTATFSWSTTSGNGFTTNTSSVNAQGMLNTVATGNIQVRAAINYSTSVPGFERQALALATVAIRPPETYKTQKLISTSRMNPSPMHLRARVVALMGNQRGQVVFNANFDGMANGPLMIQDGAQKLLATAGVPGPQPQTSVLEFNTNAINNRGEVLTLASVLFSGNVIYKIGPDGMDPVFIDSMPLPGTEWLTGPTITRNSLNDSGQWVMRANYRVAFAGPTYTAIYRVPERGFPDEIASTQTKLPDIPEPFTLDADFGIGGDGRVYFTATSGTRRVLYLERFGEVKKLLATGDALLGSTVARFVGNGFIMNNDGDLAVAVVLANNQTHLLLYPAADPFAAPKNLRLNSFSNVYTVNPQVGVLFLGDGGKGYGINLWKGTDVTAVFLQNNNASLLRGKTVPQIDYAAVGDDGGVHILARTQDKAMEIFWIRAGEPSVPLLGAGDAVFETAPISLRSMLLGDRMGPGHVLLGGAGSSIHEISEKGLKPSYLLGERYTGVALYTGSSSGDTRKNPQGDLFITPTNGMGMLRLRNGTPEFLIRAGITVAEGTTANAAGNVFVNTRGDVMWQASTNRGDTRIFVTNASGAHRTILTNGVFAAAETVVEDKVVTTWSDQMIDDAGRVMATLRFRDNSFGLFLWANGEWKRVLTPTESKINNTTILSYSTIRTNGSDFYAIVSMSGIGNSLARYRGDQWDIVMSVTDTIVTGHPVNSIGTYEVNRNGDIFAQCNTNTQVLVVKRRDGATHYIHMLNELTAEGDLLTRTSDYDLRDDGTLYFLGMTVLDEYAVYMAKPVK